MKSILLYIKQNKVATIAILACIVMVLVFIFWPVKTKRDTELNEGVVKLIDSVMQANKMLTEQQRKLTNTIDTILTKVSEKDAQIIEKHFYRDNQIRAVDNASDDVLQGLIDERYRP